MMKIAILIFLLGHVAHGQGLDKYLWENRVVIIFNTTQNNHEVQEQLKAFQRFSKEIEDREIIVLVPKKEAKSELLKKFALSNSFSGLILVGKDGGVKLRQKLVVKPEVLFTLIDAMPMRQSEMRKKAKGLD